MDKPTAKNEVESVMKSLPTQKPIPNGFTTEPRQISKELKLSYLKLFRTIEKQEILSNLSYEVGITLILKPERKKYSNRNLYTKRPDGYDAKTFNKILAPIISNNNMFEMPCIQTKRDLSGFQKCLSLHKSINMVHYLKNEM